MTDTDKRVGYPQASPRILQLMHKIKALKRLIKDIESDSEFIKYDEEIRAWFMQGDCKSFEQGGLKFGFVKYRPSKWWLMKPYEFERKFPKFAKDFNDKLFQDKEANGRMTIKETGDK